MKVEFLDNRRCSKFELMLRRRGRNPSQKNCFVYSCIRIRIVPFYPVQTELPLLKSKRFWIGLVITVVSLVLAFRGIQIAELLHAFAQINWVWLPALVLGFWLSYAGRVFRWQLLFYPYHPRWGRVLGTLSI